MHVEAVSRSCWKPAAESWKRTMSRIGKKPIVIPKGVKVDVQPGAVEIQGPKGKLRQALPTGIGFQVDGDHPQAANAP